MTIQIRFLGKSRIDNETGYRKAGYRFDHGWESDETAFFAPARDPDCTVASKQGIAERRRTAHSAPPRP